MQKHFQLAKFITKNFYFILGGLKIDLRAEMYIKFFSGYLTTIFTLPFSLLKKRNSTHLHISTQVHNYHQIRTEFWRQSHTQLYIVSSILNFFIIPVIFLLNHEFACKKYF